jgi:methionine-rich copper-binding protein CopC
MKLHTTARAAVAALMIAGCQLAHAHAFPTHQAPGAGATVATSQKDVAIDFDDGLEPAFSSITVTDAQGKPVTSAKAVVEPAHAGCLFGRMGGCRRRRAPHARSLHLHG